RVGPGPPPATTATPVRTSAHARTSKRLIVMAASSTAVRVRVAVLLRMTDGDDPRRHHVRVADQARGQILVHRLGFAFSAARESLGVAVRRLIADAGLDDTLAPRID